ncbi:hypothetical protein JL720_165 [Aureococcus anophagefferens]|nr:hypothetical protein JL720_165 [Aureococcus anophagefferens]
MKWFSSEYLENGAWTRAELPPGFPNDTNTLEASNKTLKEQCTEYTMKPVLAFLSDIVAYVQDKSQLNAEFAYDAPPSTPQTKLAKDATAVLSSVQLLKGVEVSYDMLTSGTHLTSMLLIIGVKPDLAAPPVAFISDATYVDMLRALDTNDKEAWTTEVDRRLAPFVGLATGDASSSSGRGARAVAPPTTARSPRIGDRVGATRAGERDNDTLTNPPRPAPKFAFLGAPATPPRHRQCHVVDIRRQWRARRARARSRGARRGARAVRPAASARPRARPPTQAARETFALFEKDQ